MTSRGPGSDLGGLGMLRAYAVFESSRPLPPHMAWHVMAWFHVPMPTVHREVGQSCLPAVSAWWHCPNPQPVLAASAASNPLQTSAVTCHAAYHVLCCRLRNRTRRAFRSSLIQAGKLRQNREKKTDRLSWLDCASCHASKCSSTDICHASCRWLTMRNSSKSDTSQDE